MTVPHHWPRRHFIQPRDGVGIAVEPKGHAEDGQPLYDLYRSDTQESKLLTEAEVHKEIRLLESRYDLL